MQSSKPVLTIITERKVLPVVFGIIRGSTDGVEVDVCVTCGAIVFDIIKHDLWHRA